MVRIFKMTTMAFLLGKSVLRSRPCLAFSHSFSSSRNPVSLVHGSRKCSFRIFSSTQEDQTKGNTMDIAAVANDDALIPSPWNDPRIEKRIKTRRRNNNNRFRQHVNPLARQYQQPTELSTEWPNDVFETLQNKALHVDIGCGKGGFLLSYARSEYAKQESYNYLGLEIRPLVAQFAKERVPIHGLEGKLDFLGCNANVDLDRLLQRYHEAASSSTSSTDDENASPLLLQRVSIQYPDPHFKKHHAKRRVVTPHLVDIIAKYMPYQGMVFLQSDVQNVLDDMRQRFADAEQYFQLDASQHAQDEYLPINPLAVPTEREVSVLEKDLPVYRVLFRRKCTPYQEPISSAEN